MNCTLHDTPHDKSLIINKKGHFTLHEILHDTLRETIHFTEHVEHLISILTEEMNRPQRKATWDENDADEQ